MSQNINEAFQEHTKKFLVEMSCFREAFSTIHTIKFLNSKNFSNMMLVDRLYQRCPMTVPWSGSFSVVLTLPNHNVMLSTIGIDI